MRSYCRICCRDDLESSLPLHHRSEISSETVRNMLSFVTGLKINQGDGLPQQICRICLGQLLISYQLKRTSIESQSYFLRLLSLPPPATTRQTAGSLLSSPACEVKLEPTDDDERGMLESGDVVMEEDDFEYSEVMFFCCWNEACTENFKSEDQLVAHFENRHKEVKELNEVVRANDEFVCNICARGFNDEAELLQHGLQMKRKALKCDDCYFITYDPAEYNFHNKAHDATLFRCVCGFTTTRKFSLQRHLVSLCCEEIYGKMVSVEPVQNQPSGRVNQDSTANPAQKDGSKTTNSELISMGFSVLQTRESSKFYCCISECQVEQDSELHCVQHYAKTHTAELLTADESSGKDGVKCEICRKVFQAAKDLQVHREDSFRPSFQCNTCGTDGFTRETALGHSVRVCTVKRFTCPCGFLTNESSSLTKHFNSGLCNRGLALPEGDNKEGPIKVLPVLNSDQEEASNPSASEEQQSDVKRYICKHCGTSRKTKASLKDHQQSEQMRTLTQQHSFDSGREVDGIPGKMYNCKWCNEPTNNLNHLIQCMVNSKDRFRCKKCLQKFFSKRRLEFHTWRGCSPKAKLLLDYICPYCKRRFYHPSLLERHVTMDHRTTDWAQRVLDPTRKFACTVCGFRFRRKFTLDRHMILHNRKNDGKTVATEPAADGNS